MGKEIKSPSIPPYIIEHLGDLPNANEMINYYERLFSQAQKLPKPQSLELTQRLLTGALLQSNTSH